ncbi:MAG: hypothetical protein ACJ8D7_02120 [Xanthobacteraceae bacterium]
MRKTEIGGFPALTVDGRHGRPLVLFIHGSFSTHEPFSRWLTVCEKSGWRAAVAARRGRRDLDPPCADGLTIADYLDDTRRVIDALGERPILIGHSPVRVIAAEQDRVISPALARSICDYYGAELLVHEAHGHWVIEEPGAETIAEDVIGRLDGLALRAAA